MNPNGTAPDSGLVRTVSRTTFALLVGVWIGAKNRSRVRNQTAKAGALLAAAMLLAACGTNKTEAASGAAAGACDTSKGTLTVGVIAPQSGGLSALGLGIKNSVNLAISQANEKCAVKGYRLVVDVGDDEANPQKGAQAATKFSSDPNVVGVVGTMNSSVAQTVQPILADKKIALISPANTNPSLTKGADFLTNPTRKFDSYFRVCTTDDKQGPFAADHLVKKLGKKKIAVINDGKTYGLGLAVEFEKQAVKNGATIVARETVGEKDTDFSGVVGKIKPTAPDAVYYGGEYPAGGPLRKQLRDGGVDVPMMGGDGLYDSKYFSLGGRDGDLATSVGAPVEALESAKAFVDAYKAKTYTDSYGAYGAFSYDAATAIVASLAKTMGDSTWDETKRAGLLKNIGEYKAKGATGDIGFDQYGDTTNRVLTVYRAGRGKWTAAETGTFGG